MSREMGIVIAINARFVSADDLNRGKISDVVCHFYLTGNSRLKLVVLEI